ncbi:MAG: cadherin-like domain-containing protein [Phycisphaeraceae bacterium]|nr:cadherin-like domain-containing protein [Phycisphaeraceae bacterium]
MALHNPIRWFACCLVAGVVLVAHSHGQTTYSSTDVPVTIPATGTSGIASPFPSEVKVHGETRPIGHVVVRLLGLTHTFPDDLDIVLESPTGRKVIIMSDCGGSVGISGVNLTIDDSAASALPNSSLISSGTYQPTNIGAGDTFGGISGPFFSELAAFRGTEPNGVWKLYINDDKTNDVGSLTGWEIEITPAECVTNTNNSGPGSLRQAIINANAQPIVASTPAVICFDIPGAGPHVIQPLTELPEITRPRVIIDGLTQPGAACDSWPPALKIVLDGSLATMGTVDGLMFSADADFFTVRGLVVGNFSGRGLRFESADDGIVQCNFIGTNTSGTAAAPNTLGGIRLSSTSSRNLIGGVDQLVSAEGSDEPDGDGRTEDGYDIPVAAPSGRNLISGNTGPGILLRGATFNAIVNNYIGVAVDGTTLLPNGGDGVLLDTDARDNTIGSDFNGVDDELEGNVIAGNGRDGVRLASSAGVRNTIVRNSIFANTALGIDLGGDGVTANDNCDPDGGPNRLKNWPVLTSADAMGNVVGTLNSEAVPGRTYRIDFYQSDTADPSGHGEGRVWVGSIEVMPMVGTCLAPFNVALSFIPGLPYVSAVTTDPLYGSSEFSNVVQIQGGSADPIEAVDDEVAVCEDGVLMGNVLDNDEGPITGISSFTNPSNGQLMLDTSTGQFTYTPDPDYCGADSFQYTATDGVGGSSTATVDITVTCVNDRPNFGIMSNPQLGVEDGGEQCKIGFVINFFGKGGDDEASQQPAEYIITELVNGALLSSGPTVSLDGTLCFTPAPDACGTVTFRLAVRDDGGTATCTDSAPNQTGIDTSFSIPVVIEIKCINDPPVARCRNVVIDTRSECVSTVVTAEDVNDGSSDPEDGTDLTFELCFDDGSPVPPGYSFPLGTTDVLLKVTDHGLDCEGDGCERLTSSCRATVTVLGEDCNGNGQPDSCDIANGFSQDCNGDGIPDECECLWDNCVVDEFNGPFDIAGAVSLTNNGQVSHMGGGVPLGARVADDFVLCEGYAHKITLFRGDMITNTISYLRKAKLEFFEDCDGVPAAEPFASFVTDRVIRTVPNIAPGGYDLVTYEFRLCDACLWLEGGKTYWVSLTGKTDNVNPDKSYWVGLPGPRGPGDILGLPPKKADGVPTGTNTWGVFAFGPWVGLEACCIGCVNMCFSISGESCKVIWDNGEPDLHPGPVVGGPSGSLGGSHLVRSADNFVTGTCKEQEVCLIEGWIWTNCNPPHIFLELYEDDPCVMDDTFNPPIHRQMPGPKRLPIPQFTATPTCVFPLPETVLVDGYTLRGYRVIFADLGWQLLPGQNYWVSIGATGNGSFSGRTYFTAKKVCDPCEHIKIKPSVTRRLSPPETGWVSGEFDLAFRVAVRERSIPIKTPLARDGSGPAAPTCAGDYNRDGVLDLNDLLDFLNDWLPGCP